MNSAVTAIGWINLILLVVLVIVILAVAIRVLVHFFPDQFQGLAWQAYYRLIRRRTRKFLSQAGVKTLALKEDIRLVLRPYYRLARRRSRPMRVAAMDKTKAWLKDHKKMGAEVMVAGIAALFLAYWSGFDADFWLGLGPFRKMTFGPIQTYLTWKLWGGIAITLVIMVAGLYANQIGWKKTYESYGNKAWRLILIVAGVVVLHWLFRANNPDAWDSWYAGQTFWPMNIAILLAAFLLSQTGPARYLGFALVGMTVIVLLTELPSYVWPKFETSVTASAPAPSAYQFSSQPSSDSILAAIALCESGGAQFAADGTPLRNPKEGSTAIGKYQIVESLHGEKAKAMGYDLATLEGNEAYARHLYTAEGTEPWKASEHCWKAAYATPVPVPSLDFTVKANPGEWSQKYQFPLGRKLRIEAAGPNWRFALMTGGKVYTFTPEHSDDLSKMYVSDASFKSLSDAVEDVRLVFQ